MSEIDSMKSIEEALESLDDPAKKRVLDWACARYLGVRTTSNPVTAIVQDKSSNKEKRKVAKNKSKGKTMPKQIKDLNLKPIGKKSGNDFALEKKPTNVMQKCVVSVYYLRDELGLSAITVDHVFTFFKNAAWKVPADLVNTLQQAGTAGWLDTADSQNILITPMGENLVEHDLPKAAK